MKRSEIIALSSAITFFILGIMFFFLLSITNSFWLRDIIGLGVAMIFVDSCRKLAWVINPMDEKEGDIIFRTINVNGSMILFSSGTGEIDRQTFWAFVEIANPKKVILPRNISDMLIMHNYNENLMSFYSKKDIKDLVVIIHNEEDSVFIAKLKFYLGSKITLSPCSS